MRLVTSSSLTLIAAAEMYVGVPFGLGLMMWFALAVAIGVVAGHWWALALAAVPWPLGVGGGLVSGRYAYLGDGWQAILTMIVGIGLLGIAMGLLVRLGRAELHGSWPR